MANPNTFLQLRQAHPELVSETFQQLARGAVRQLLTDAMAAEVALLTGKLSRKDWGGSFAFVPSLARGGEGFLEYG